MMFADAVVITLAPFCLANWMRSAGASLYQDRLPGLSCIRRSIACHAVMSEQDNAADLMSSSSSGSGLTTCGEYCGGAPGCFGSA